MRLTNGSIKLEKKKPAQDHTQYIENICSKAPLLYKYVSTKVCVFTNLCTFLLVPGEEIGTKILIGVIF